MSIYAIGAVRELNGTIGARLISTESGKCMDVEVGQLYYYITREEGVKNLEYNAEGKVHWKQGSMERYPFIDKQNNVIQNKESVVVLGVGDLNGSKLYRICNCSGKCAVVKTEDLIQHAKEHKIANCKVVKRGKTEYIAAIEGTLDEVDAKPTFKMDYDLQCLTVTIPFLTSTTLEIPDNINGKPIFKVSCIKIQPEITALSIRKLVLSKYIKDITMGIFSSMPNLEEVDILADDVNLYDDAFSANQNIKKIYIKSIKASGIGVFAGLSELEEFKTDTPMEYINSNAFYGCKKLDINSVLLEGTTFIGVKAFYGNKTTTDLVIPSTVTVTYDNAFENSIIKRVDIRTEILNIRSNSRSRKPSLFSSRDKVEVYVNKNCVVDTNYLGQNVVLIKREATDKDISAEKKIKKSSLIGIDLDNTKVLRTTDEIANVIMALKQEDLTKSIMSLIQSALKSTWKIKTGEFEYDGFKISLTIAQPYKPNNAKLIKNIGKYIVVTGKSMSIYPCDRLLVKNYLLRKVNKQDMTIRPKVVSSKYLKSMDVADDGAIRLIYENEGKRDVIKITDFALPSDNEVIT